MLFGAALALAVAWVDATACTMIKIAELPVRLVRNKLIVDGAINGQKIGVLLDTGATFTWMMRSATDGLGLERHETRGGPAFAVGGPSKIEFTLVDEFKLGNASRKGWRMPVTGDREYGGDFAVALGEDFFSQVDLEFDLAHNAVRLFTPKDCDGVSLAYWTTEEPREVAIDSFDDNRPQILMTVQINERPIKAMLDSGASASILSKAQATEFGIALEVPSNVGASKNAEPGRKRFDTWTAQFDSFIIGNELIKNPKILLGDLYKDWSYSSGGIVKRSAIPEQPMLLGADFLRAHRVLVSHSQRKMYFTYLGGPVFATPPRPSQSGAEPRTDNDAPPKSGET